MNNYSETLSNINTEIVSLHKRISILENINKITNNREYFYKINNFGIPYIDQVLLNKNYYYLKPHSNIRINFSCDFKNNKNLYDSVIFMVNILDNNYEISYSKDRNINFTNHISFELNLTNDSEIIKPNIKFIILGKNERYINYGDMFMDGYHFYNCKLYITFD